MEIQKAASVEQIVADHIKGLGGYEIADKYGLDSEVVKDVIKAAEARGDLKPGAKPAEPAATEPLAEGENPEPKVMTTDNSV